MTESAMGSDPFLFNLRQAWAVPSNPRPIVCIGAGGIIRTAHLPIYQRLRFPVAGIFDINPAAADETSRAFDVRAFPTLQDAVATSDAVFDIAVPADQITSVLEELPRGAAVLIQKPMGEHLAGAARIRQICQDHGLVAAQNFQLRFSPNVLALRDFISQGHIGSIVDLEVRVVVRQPWELWTFLEGAPRLEVLYHSIHYLDLIRALLGEPRGVYCKALEDPRSPKFADTRSTIILDYGETVRCSLLLNHGHSVDARQRASFIKLEGTAGAAMLTMGVNLSYPEGPSDSLEVAVDGAGWRTVPLRGSWFIEAFEGPMSNLQRFVAGEDSELHSPIDDAIRTMALVEACYMSSASGATPIPDVP